MNYALRTYLNSAAQMDPELRREQMGHLREQELELQKQESMLQREWNQEQARIRRALSEGVIDMQIANVNAAARVAGSVAIANGMTGSSYYDLMGDTVKIQAAYHQEQAKSFSNVPERVQTEFNELEKMASTESGNVTAARVRDVVIGVADDPVALRALEKQFDATIGVQTDTSFAEYVASSEFGEQPIQGEAGLMDQGLILDRLKLGRMLDKNAALERSAFLTEATEDVLAVNMAVGTGYPSIDPIKTLESINTLTALETGYPVSAVRAYKGARRAQMDAKREANFAQYGDTEEGKEAWLQTVGEPTFHQEVNTAALAEIPPEDREALSRSPHRAQLLNPPPPMASAPEEKRAWIERESDGAITLAADGVSLVDAATGESSGTWEGLLMVYADSVASLEAGADDFRPPGLEAVQGRLEGVEADIARYEDTRSGWDRWRTEIIADPRFQKFKAERGYYSDDYAIKQLVAEGRKIQREEWAHDYAKDNPNSLLGRIVRKQYQTAGVRAGAGLDANDAASLALGSEVKTQEPAPPAEEVSAEGIDQPSEPSVGEQAQIEVGEAKAKSLAQIPPEALEDIASLGLDPYSVGATMDALDVDVDEAIRRTQMHALEEAIRRTQMHAQGIEPPPVGEPEAPAEPAEPEAPGEPEAPAPPVPAHVLAELKELGITPEQFASTLKGGQSVRSSLEQFRTIQRGVDEEARSQKPPTPEESRAGLIDFGEEEVEVQAPVPTPDVPRGTPPVSAAGADAGAEFYAAGEQAYNEGRYEEAQQNFRRAEAARAGQPVEEVTPVTRNRRFAELLRAPQQS